MTVVSAVALVGTITKGPDFMAEPLPLPPFVAAIWFTINFLLLAFGIFTVYRNTSRFMDRWTWQEMAFSRGTLFLMFGGVLGYFTRLFDHPTCTLGTPVITLGALALIYATLSPPVRLTNEDRS